MPHKMKKVILVNVLFSLIVGIKSYSQDIQITKPLLEFDGDQLLISYDFTGGTSSDHFYVWVEIENKKGDQIKMKSMSGDIGKNIKFGKNKKIKWVPENDSVIINEEVSVKIKAEKYIVDYNKASLLLYSAAFPGWGQTRISNGKPWWLIGVASYGALAGGYIIYQSYLKTYSDYKAATSASQRTDLFALSQKKFGSSSTLLISGVTLWAVNLAWLALTPERFRPLQYVKLSLIQSSSFKSVPGFTLCLNF